MNVLLKVKKSLNYVMKFSIDVICEQLSQKGLLFPSIPNQSHETTQQTTSNLSQTKQKVDCVVKQFN